MEYLVECKNIENVVESELNDICFATDYALLYTSLPYLKLLKEYLKCDIGIVVAKLHNSVVAFMPLAFKTNSVYGTVCNSLPFYGSNGGIIISPIIEDRSALCSVIIEEYNKLIVERKCIASTIISNPLDLEGNKWLQANVQYDLIDERIGQITGLPNKQEQNVEQMLMSSFEDPRPRNIRKAIKEGVAVYCLNSQEAIDFLHAVHYDNITAINGIAKEKHFFDLIPGFFNDKEFKIYIAEQNGVKIAALLLFYCNKTVEYFTPAVVEEYRGLQPTSLIIYKAMIDAVNDDYKYWNWGGTWLSQGGVYDFKKRWGTKDYPYFYYTRIYDESILSRSKELLLKEFPYFFVAPFAKLKVTN